MPNAFKYSVYPRLISRIVNLWNQIDDLILQTKQKRKVLFAFMKSISQLLFQISKIGKL